MSLPIELSICDICEEVVSTEFFVSPEVWEKVTGHKPDPDGCYAEGYWCLPCFIVEAEKKLGNADFTIQVAVRAEWVKQYQVPE